MNSAARPRNDTTKLRALATGLRLMTTAAPKITVTNAKIQNRNGDISDSELWNAKCGLVGSFLIAHFKQCHTSLHRTLVILNEMKALTIEAFANE